MLPSKSLTVVAEELLSAKAGPWEAQMAVTRAVPRSLIAAPTVAPRAIRRVSVRVWALLHAQALLHGRPAGTSDAVFIEDDRFRLSRRG